MGGNGSYNKLLKKVEDIKRTHFCVAFVDGHKVLLLKENERHLKIPMNSNSESPLYLCAKREDDGTIQIISIGIYEKHLCVGQIDLKFDKEGRFIPYDKNSKESSHYHHFGLNDIGEVNRKSHDKKNCLEIESKYLSLIEKINKFNLLKFK